MTTMEEVIEMEVSAIEELCDADCFSLEQMIDGIKAKCANIRRTLCEGDSEPRDEGDAYLSQPA